MKKVIITACILVYTILGINIYAQDLSVSVTSGDASSVAAADGQVEVIVDSGEPDYVFFLYDNEPWQDANLIGKSAPTYDNRYVFENLPPGRYFAGVIDNSGRSTFKEININVTDN
jgi:hypothetical protein